MRPHRHGPLAPRDPRLRQPRDVPSPIDVRGNQELLEKEIEEIREWEPRLVQRPGYIWIDGREYRVIGHGHYRPVPYAER